MEITLDDFEKHSGKFLLVAVSSLLVCDTILTFSSISIVGTIVAVKRATGRFVQLAVPPPRRDEQRFFFLFFFFFLSKRRGGILSRVRIALMDSFSSVVEK